MNKLKFIWLVAALTLWAGTAFAQVLPPSGGFVSGGQGTPPNPPSRRFTPPPALPRTQVREGYLPAYRFDSVNLAEVGRNFDRVIIFSVGPTAEGEIDLTGVGNLGIVKRLKDAGVKQVFLAVGGANRSSNMLSVCSQSPLRAAFVTNLVELCNASNIDGVDLDWEEETPQAKAAAKPYLNQLIVDLSSALHGVGKKVSAAVSDREQLTSSAVVALDLLHLMLYEQRAQEGHSTFDYAEREVTEWSLRVSPVKISLGVPFFGKNLATGDAKTYADLVGMVKAAGSDINLDMVAGYSYNGPATIARKLAFAKSRGLGAVFAWEIGQDAPGADSLGKLFAK